MLQKIRSSIIQSTRVTFAAGKLREASRILEIWQLPSAEPEIAILTESTPFHPVDHTWPDQPADRGVIHIGSTALNVSNCLTAAVNVSTGEVALEREIPAKRGEQGWAFLVAHLVQNSEDIKVEVGRSVDLEVDPIYRHNVSRVHSACHLMALALNKTTSHLWSKTPPATDSLGNPNLDQLAIQSSRLSERQSHDIYRTGKSLRKKGFQSKQLATELSDVSTRMQETITKWIADASPVKINASDPTLAAQREWQTTLEGQPVAIPCGGTHVRSLGEIEGVHLDLVVDDDGKTIRVTTTVQ